MQKEKNAELNAQEEELLARFGAVMEMSGVRTPPLDGGLDPDGLGDTPGEQLDASLEELKGALEKEQQRQGEGGPTGPQHQEDPPLPLLPPPQ
jgi:hypothetical protein